MAWLLAEPAVSAYVFASIAGFHDTGNVIQQAAANEDDITNLYQSALEEMAREQ